MNGIGRRESTFWSLTCYLININQFSALSISVLKQTILITLDKHNNNIFVKWFMWDSTIFYTRTDKVMHL